MRKTPCVRSAIAFVLIAFVYLFVARPAAAQSFCRVSIVEDCNDMVVGNTKILHARGRPQGERSVGPRPRAAPTSLPTPEPAVRLHSTPCRLDL
ncbi:MAG: hypothetical protein HY286_07195 [Planctomycetes bacterium]|nr:hypothetical protein [Planctomycetota bacterium]